jgi:hypothetical protein
VRWVLSLPSYRQGNEARTRVLWVAKSQALRSQTPSCVHILDQLGDLELASYLLGLILLIWNLVWKHPSPEGYCEVYEGLSPGTKNISFRNLNSNPSAIQG